ncbi:MAG: putative GTP-binding protein EngB [Firmicutes bacterium ADurb.Bin182]|nr:MAG: putative GTP-binding protein EngB [Firmicutes bacterium ADurb.Bin182]
MGIGGSYPGRLPAEIALAGKSNVGKSSLINSLCNNHKLARTSKVPGKTRLINYYSINNRFYFVDLPGYGFAKVSGNERESWGRLMEGYLSSGRLSHIFLLLDIRHDPSEEDKRMYEWIIYYGVPHTLIATKADKLPRAKRQPAADSCAKKLGAPPFAMVFSAKTAQGRQELLCHIGRILSDAERSAPAQKLLDIE